MMDTRTYIVTGAAGGIGGATVVRLLSEGHNVLGIDISDRRLKLISEQAAGLPGKFETLRCDLGDESIARAAVAHCLECFGDLHGVANVAGGMAKLATESMDQPIDRIDLDYFRRTFTLNVDTAFVLTKAAEPHMRRQGYGKIVNVASLAAFANRNELGDIPYCAAKAAVIGMTQAMSLILGSAGIRVNCVAPGLVLNEATINNLDEGFKARHLAVTPLGRLATPADEAEVIAFFLEPASDAVTGEVIRVAAGVR